MNGCLMIIVISKSLDKSEQFVGVRLLITLKWRLKRWLCLRSDPCQMTPLAISPVEESRVCDDTVLLSLVLSRPQDQYTHIPNDYCSRKPSDTSLQILRERDMIIQELEKHVRLFFLVSHNVTSNCPVRRDPVFGEENTHIVD